MPHGRGHLHRRRRDLDPHSYFSTDNRKSYCVYDGPTPEAIRKVAIKNRLPVNRITEVRVLDPYFYRAA